MIIFVIDNLCVAIFKTKGNTPIGLYGYRPSLFSFALQFMKGQSWNAHVVNGSGLIELGEDEPQPSCVFCLYPRQASSKEEFLQSFMGETQYHVSIVTCMFPYRNLVGYVF